MKCASFLEPIYSCSSSDLRLGTHFFFFLISLCLSLSLFQCSLFCFGFLFYFLVIFDAMGYSETQEGKKNNEHGENRNTFFFSFLFWNTYFSPFRTELDHIGLNWKTRKKRIHHRCACSRVDGRTVHPCVSDTGAAPWCCTCASQTWTLNNLFLEWIGILIIIK